MWQSPLPYKYWDDLKILRPTGSMLSLLVCLFPKSTFSGILCLLQHCRRNIAAPSVCPRWPITASCLYLQQSLFISYYLIFSISAVLLFNIGIHHNLSQTWPFLPDLWQQKHSLLHSLITSVFWLTFLPVTQGGKITKLTPRCPDLSWCMFDRFLLPGQ